MLSNKYIFVGCVVFGGLIVIALGANLLSPYNPLQLDVPSRFQAPSLNHPFGTDDLGRDVLSRVIFGSRISLLVGIVAVSIGVSVGVPVGLIAGYYGKWTDAIDLWITVCTHQAYAQDGGPFRLGA